MPKILTLALAFWLCASAAGAQEAPGSELSAYERQRYEGRLWEVPREPYQSDFNLYRHKNNLYIPPESPAAPSSSRPAAALPGAVKSPVNTAPAPPIGSGAKVRQRYQSETKFRQDQRDISRRSRQGGPAPLKIHDPARPGPFGQKR